MEIFLENLGDDKLEPAIAIRRALRELHTNEELQKLVFCRIRKFLDRLALKTPKQIVCFFGKLFNFPKKTGCLCQDIYLFNEKWEAIYLGTVFNKKAIEWYPIVFSGLFSKEEMKKWKTGKQKKIIKGAPHSEIIIRSETEKIDDNILIDALKKYFQRFERTKSRLAKSLVCWLSSELGEKLDEKIRQKAKQTAKKISGEEFRRKFGEEEL